MTAEELQRLWPLSGDKVCMSCKATVSPAAMRPPGPANFYSGKCRQCASLEYRNHQLRVYGKITDRPPAILLKDGTSITVAELARRHRERAAGQTA